MHDLPPNYPPNYDEWLRKSCWRIKEICYLAQGLDPGCIPGGIILESDEESGEIESRAMPINNEALVIAIEFYDLIKRAIESGDLKPPMNEGKCFKPQDVIEYLNRKSVSIPRGVTLPQELQLSPPEAAKEAEAINGINNEPESEICDLFNPMNRKAIMTLFYKISKDDWVKYFGRAARNKLKEAREGKTKPYQYNPVKVSNWLVKKGLCSQEHVNRKLAKNLPERSKDKKYLITEELD